jgi:branched-subunit amino acid ABC-type transport system permease component
VSEYLPFIVVGLMSGSVYAISAMGLVVTYTTSGVFNFAHGAVAMIATFAFYSLRVDAGLPTWLAAAVAVLGVGPALGVVIDRVLLRRLQGAAGAAYLVVSLGLLVSLQGLAIAVYGPATRTVDPIFPTSTFRLPGVNVGYDQAMVMVIAAVSGVALALFFRHSRLGVQTRAVVDDPDLTELVGVNGGRVRTASWMLGCAFAALSGVLLAPFLGVDAVLLTLLAIQAFGAAVVGRLVSLPLTYAGALLIGVGASLSAKFVSQHPSLAGLPTSLPFVVLFGVLVLSSRGSFAEVVKGGGEMVFRSARTLTGRRFPFRQLLGLAVVAAAVPSFTDGAQLLTATRAAAFVLVFSSLGLLVGLSRQISLCHAIFVVFGATTLSHLQTAGVPYLVALLVAGLSVVPIGAVVAIPAIRLSGLFLALATFGFGVLAQYLLLATPLLFGGKVSLYLARPELFGVSLGGDTAFYLFVVVVVLAGLVAVEAARVTRIGRILRALADSPTATESVGVNPVAARVLVFCLSAFLAAIAGGVLGTLTGVVNTESFGFFESLVWITVLVTAGPSSLGGAVLAALLLVVLPAVFTSPSVTEWQPVAFGVAAMILAQARNGLAGLVRWPNFSARYEESAWRLNRGRTAERMAARAAAS